MKDCCFATARPLLHCVVLSQYRRARRRSERSSGLVICRPRPFVTPQTTTRFVFGTFALLSSASHRIMVLSCEQIVGFSLIGGTFSSMWVHFYGFDKRVGRPGVETLSHPCEACHLASDVDNGRAHRVLSTSLMSTNLSTSRVFGVVTVQTGLYLRRFRNDPRVLRFLVSYRSELPKTPTSLLFRPISTRSHPTLGETNTVVIGMTA